MKPLLTLAILGLALGLVSCVGPPPASPAVLAHASGGTVGVSPTGMMMMGGQSSTVNLEAQKSQAFWGGGRR